MAEMDMPALLAGLICLLRLGFGDGSNESCAGRQRVIWRRRWLRAKMALKNAGRILLQGWTGKPHLTRFGPPVPFLTRL
tara:strand:- start:212 stop:448 length:237 start_codon:yes stop_codon:yes gene_type:complete